MYVIYLKGFGGREEGFMKHDIDINLVNVSPINPVGSNAFGGLYLHQ